MKITFLAKSLSELAGGLLPVTQRLGQLLSTRTNSNVYALGIYDKLFDKDTGGWQPVEAKACNYLGPHSFGYSPEMKRSLFDINPDLVHTHGLFYYTSLLANQWGQKFKKPVIITPHGMLDAWALKNSQWKKNFAAWLFENRHLKNSYCIHSLCESETHSIRNYGLKRKPVCQIPNGIDLPDLSRDLICPWAARVEKGKKVLLFLSRIHPKKGLPNLLTAWAEVRKKTLLSKEWVLAIAGWSQTGHLSELEAMVNDLSLVDSVIFLGPQFDDDKAASYLNADAFILPSYSEGLPMVILEAWAYGLPVLMTPQCNIPEGFLNGAAIQIQPESLSIQQGLRDFFLLTDGERLTIGQRGKKLVEDQFTWDRVAEDMHSVYKWILGGGQPPSCVITD